MLTTYSSLVGWTFSIYMAHATRHRNTPKEPQKIELYFESTVNRVKVKIEYLTKLYTQTQSRVALKCLSK